MLTVYDVIEERKNRADDRSRREPRYTLNVDRLKALMDQYEISGYQIARALGYRSAVGVYNWLDHKTAPSLDNFFRLVEFFDVHPADLVQRADEE